MVKRVFNFFPCTELSLKGKRNHNYKTNHKREYRKSCQSFSSPWKPTVEKKVLFKSRYRFSLKLFSSGATSPNMVTDSPRKFVKWIKILRQRVWENPSNGTHFLIRRQIVWKIYSSATIFPDRARGCLRYLICLSILVSTVNQNDFHLRSNFWTLHRVCSSEVERFRFMELSM